MSPSASTPVVIGVGDFINRSKKAEDAVEPLQLMLNAIEVALQDTGLSKSSLDELRSAIDSLDVVRTWTWPYPDLPGLIAQRMGIDPKRKHYTDHGGNQPGLIFDEAARRISKGESEVAILTGGEALASLSACAAKKQLPPPGWTPTKESVNDVFSPTTRELKTDLGAKHGIGNPIHIYPLYENGFRAARKQSVLENHRESAEMYADFAKVAEGNEYAWSYGSPTETAESIGALSKKNRMICHPYPLLMNAFNNINLAAACILTSTDFARKLGVPEEKWIYPLGGAGTKDSDDFWLRPNFHTSPSISASLDAALQASNQTASSIDLFDFYSCFPIVPKLARTHLSLPQTTPLTLLGGLTSFGGAGNNYSMHALTEMTRQLRRSKASTNGRASSDGRASTNGGASNNSKANSNSNSSSNSSSSTGLILTNGGVLTYQHAVVLSTSPREDGSTYPSTNPLPTLLPSSPPELQETAEGAAVIETYTVAYARSGAPELGYVVGRLLGNGRRFIANHADERTLVELSSMEEEQVGRRGRVWCLEGGRNVFAFDGEGTGRGARL